MSSCDGWTKELFGWMVDRASALAPGRKVRAVILGAIPLDEPDERIAVFESLGAEAQGLVIDQSNANADEPTKALAAADIIFIRGGDQSRYVNWWKGTATEAAIRSVFERGGVIGGTSAGCAILGEVSYDAKTGSLSSDEALTNATHANISLTTGFLNFCPGVLFDTHFTERSRLARAAVLLAHANANREVPIQALGVDPCTAVIVSPTGERSVKGRGQVTQLEYVPANSTSPTSATLHTNMPPVVGPLSMAIYAHGQTIGAANPPHADAPNSSTRTTVLGITWNRRSAQELQSFLMMGAAERDLRTLTLEQPETPEAGPAAAVVFDFRASHSTPEPFKATGIRLWVHPNPSLLNLAPPAK